MFRLAAEPTFTTEAIIHVPTDTGVEKQPMRARFRMLPADHPANHAADGYLTFLQASLISVYDVVDDAGARWKTARPCARNCWSWALCGPG